MHGAKDQVLIILITTEPQWNRVTLIQTLLRSETWDATLEDQMIVAQMMTTATTTTMEMINNEGLIVILRE